MVKYGNLHPPFLPYLPPGPSPKIAIVGEAPGASEQLTGRPFVGASGQLLRSLMKRADLSLDQCYLTNVFWERPPDNQISAFFCLKKFAQESYAPTRLDMPAEYSLPQGPKGFVQGDKAEAVYRLREEIEQINPNLIIALGAVALWALTGLTKIMKSRGYVMEGAPSHPDGTPIKILPSIHPAAIFRSWKYLNFLSADLIKAALESTFPEIRRPPRTIYINPTLDDIRTFLEEELRPAPIISVDIETRARQITCISFSPSPELSLVIPFWVSCEEAYLENPTVPSYWGSVGQETQAWELVREILELPQPKLMQLGNYDLWYLWRCMGIKPRNAGEDTGVLHHSLFPELPRALAFMGSVWTNEPNWKRMRTFRSGEKDKDE